MTADEVLFTVEGSAGIITLNRPQALNALTRNMVQLMDRQLVAWAENRAIQAVIITGAGDRAFCSGGDVKSVALDVKAGGEARKHAGEFFREEYTLNNRIFEFPKPYISLINGIVMGGGKGISAHGSHRIITENTLFAMPEAGIGFFPDVGGGYFLPRCPGQTGLYLALTGKRIKASDTLYIGFGTHFVTAAKIDELRSKIAAAPHDLEALLEDFSSAPADASEILRERVKIDRCFAHDRIEEILKALEKDASPFAMETLKIMRSLSPSSLKIALRQIRRGASMKFAEVMTMEYRLSRACINRHDFYEGVRAALIDKDRQPKWSPATVEDVRDADIEACFQSLGAEDLIL
jgi:enoyl-CoA hydratase